MNEWNSVDIPTEEEMGKYLKHVNRKELEKVAAKELCSE
jgi:hypothetical protein